MAETSDTRVQRHPPGSADVAPRRATEREDVRRRFERANYELEVDIEDYHVLRLEVRDAADEYRNASSRLEFIDTEIDTKTAELERLRDRRNAARGVCNDKASILEGKQLELDDQQRLVHDKQRTVHEALEELKGGESRERGRRTSGAGRAVLE